MIKQFAKSESKNDNQLQIIFNIIDRCETKDEVSKMVSLLSSRTKVGLTFDEAPIVKSKNKIWMLEKDKELSFIGDKDSPRHKLILGDNYDALNNLLITHRNRIDVIYIDPPYNTGGSDLGYHDKFTKDAWLNFMKERMILAKELLKDDGVIFVSLDDNMQAYFKVMMDEVFGEQNFVSTLIWNKHNAQNDAKLIESNHEYIITYAKNKELLDIKKIAEENNSDKTFSLLLGNTSAGLLNNRYKMGQTVYWNPNTDEKIIRMDYDLEKAKYSNDPNIYINDNKLISEGFLPIRPKIYNGYLGRWKWSAEKMENEKERLVVRKTKDGNLTLDYKDNREFSLKGRKSIIDGFSSGSGSKEINILNLNFSNPKNVELIKYLIDMSLKKNAVVLDFFAGSGTTGQAVLELNKEDDGNREFILCTKEIDDRNNIGIDVCWERLYRINKGKTSLGETNFEWVNKNEPFNNSLDVYRVEEKDISIFSNDKNLNLNVYNELNPSLDLQQEDVPYIMNNLSNHLWRK